MSYSQLTLQQLGKIFKLNFIENLNLFENIKEIKPSSLLEEILENNISLAVAIGTEKARSELIIAPILVELRNYFHKKISLFSGVEFNVDLENGLNGICDFIIIAKNEIIRTKKQAVIPVFTGIHVLSNSYSAIVNLLNNYLLNLLLLPLWKQKTITLNLA